MLGRLRAIAQTISYEVRIALVLLFPLLLIGTFRFIEVQEGESNVWLAFIMVPIALIWLVTCVAETNRAPFDFAEGESELVSGFNIEYGRAGFALIFFSRVCKYFSYEIVFFCNFLFFCFFFVLRSIAFFNRDFMFIVKVLFFAFAFI